MRGIVALLIVGVAFSGCMTEGTGSASVYVKDAPTDEFDEIHVVFSKVSVHKGGDNSTNGTWMTLFENATGQDLDLLNLSGNRAAFLGEANLTAGTYTQIRIEVLEAYGIQNGTRVDFTVPSGTLKVVRSFELEAGKESRIVIDFDLDRSIKQTGKAWKMTPVIGKTTVTVVDSQASGAEAHEEGEATRLEELA